jgi:hypothetical protein
MKIGIIKGQIPADQTILKDDEPAFGVDFSGVASDLWALRWDSETKKGEIEWATGPVANQPVTSEAEIDSALGGVTLQTLLTRHQTKLDADAAAAAAALIDDTLPTWMWNRLQEYPDPSELVVALYDTGDKAALVTKRAAVKAKWPKDDSGPIE